MIIFFADRPLTINSRQEVVKNENHHFDRVTDLRLVKSRPSDLNGHVLFLNVTAGFAVDIVHLLQHNPPVDLLSVTLMATDKDTVVDRVKQEFKVIKAAGGVVTKEGKCLLIFRKKKWDLPKGKLDKGERSRDAALREIEEETGVKGVLKGKICTTWHTYKENNELMLKRTKWYRVACECDKHMKPQESEDIERLEWVSPAEARSLLVNSYSSIRYVFEHFGKEDSLVN